MRPASATVNAPPADLEHAVRERYADGARRVEPGLCCPTIDYDPALLEILPEELIEKDYGCGDPSRHVRSGETVLDLGSGAGKVCYILSQRVGPGGRVIGLDFNDAMLALARKHQSDIARRIGHDNVRFAKARIQDMALDLDAAARWLAEHPVTTIEQASAFEAHCGWLRRSAPLVADDSIDVIVSNCVLNLVQTEQKQQLFGEMHRVLRRGGRCVISDIVSDEDPTPRTLSDPHLWSGCIAGAFREDRFVEMFEEAGFYGVEILKRSSEPWQVIDGVEFRSMTVCAYKGKEGPCFEHHQAVVYSGPWKQVVDDDGHVLRRGERMAVCGKTYGILTDPAGPYGRQIIGIEPTTPVAVDDARPFDCRGAAVRDPRQTKGTDYRETRPADGPVCVPGSGCC
jgi:SAM-dependent methyltransferase